MIRIAIIDDNRDICTQIEAVLLKYAQKKGCLIDVEVFYSGESFVEYLNQGNSFDLIYLDIEMDELNGIDVGQQIRKIQKNYIMEIVYVTGVDKYDRQLFDVQPLNFISKPIDESLVIENLVLAMERGSKFGGTFRYKKGYEKYSIPIENILYFESLGKEMMIVTSEKEHVFNATMEAVMEKLSKYRFLRTHRSYLANARYISVQGFSEITMSNGVKLPIGKSYRKELRDLLMTD